MRLRNLAPLALPFALFVGCTIKEVPPSNNPTTAGTPVAATPTVAPTDTTAAPPAPTATTGLINANTAKPIAAMTKANSFGQPAPFNGAIAGQVFDIPPTTTALPSFAGMQPFTTVYSQSWNIPDRDFQEGFPGIEQNRVEWFAIHWDGTIMPTKAGTYGFKIVSDDGARMFIDDVLVVNNDGLHSAKKADGHAILTAGPHHMVLDYFQGPKWRIALQVLVKPENGFERPLTSSF